MERRKDFVIARMRKNKDKHIVEKLNSLPPNIDESELIRQGLVLVLNILDKLDTSMSNTGQILEKEIYHLLDIIHGNASLFNAHIGEPKIKPIVSKIELTEEQIEKNMDNMIEKFL